MSDSIFHRQNEPFLLQCLVAQSRKYTAAKWLRFMREVSIFILVVMSICSSVCELDEFTAFSGFGAVGVSIAGKYIGQAIKKWKSCAAQIQQYVDVSLYTPLVGNKASDWGNVPSKTEIAEMIVSYKTIDATSYRNWYSDYSTLSAEAQIFRSQSENVRWSSKQHRKYRMALLGICGCFGLVVLVLLFFKNPSFVKVVCMVSLLAPIVEYVILTVKELNESIKSLDELWELKGKVEKVLETDSTNTILNDLIEFQDKIFKQRAQGFLIPDFVYKLFKSRFQQQEDWIAENV